MKGMDKKIKRAVSGTLAAVMAASAGIASFGAAGVPVCDEAMYVTMDPYGGISEASVVKSYELHGAREITDRGTYQAVHNMTGMEEPEVDGDTVIFRLLEEPENDRFYFEGRMEPEEVSETLPWDIAVSYRLNGVERRLEELAHEKGVLKISIDAVPNTGTSEYFRNNMTMEIAAVVDMDQNLSVEAPGAQIQSIGSMKTVLFMVMPGEEQHFELEIGSNDLEFSGLLFLMAPVTISQLERLEDLRKARDTVKDSADAIGDSLDVVLDSLDGLQGGLGSTVEGLGQLDRSRQILSDAKGGIYVDADQALALLKELSDRGIPFPAYVEEARKALEDMNGELNSMIPSVQALADQLESLGYGLKHVTMDLNDTADLLYDTRHDVGDLEDGLARLRKDLEELKEKKEAVLPVRRREDEAQAVNAVSGTFLPQGFFQGLRGMAALFLRHVLKVFRPQVFADGLVRHARHQVRPEDVVPVFVQAVLVKGVFLIFPGEGVGSQILRIGNAPFQSGGFRQVLHQAGDELSPRHQASLRSVLLVGGSYGSGG